MGSGRNIPNINKLSLSSEKTLFAEAMPIVEELNEKSKEPNFLRRVREVLARVLNEHSLVPFCSELNFTQQKEILRYALCSLKEDR